MQTAAPDTSRRARVGEEARPSRGDRHVLAPRALLGCQRTDLRAARRAQGFATFGEPTFGPKTGKFLTQRAESAARSSMTSTRSERVEIEAATQPSSMRRLGMAGESFGDAALGLSRTAPSKSVTRAGGSLKSASPQVRIPCVASRQGLVAVNAPTSKASEAFKKRKRPPALRRGKSTASGGIRPRQVPWMIAARSCSRKWQ